LARTIAWRGAQTTIKAGRRIGNLDYCIGDA
jgi:hypothetical protein